MAHPLVYRAQRFWRDLNTPLDDGGNGDGVQAAETSPKKTRLPKGEKGTTGLKVSGGRIRREYNADLLTLSSRMVAFEEMRRSDTAIAAIESLISLPIREAEWDIEPGDDEDMADELRQNLGVGGGSGTMSHSFDDFLREVLLAPLFGMTVHEKVFDPQPSGWMGWRKFAERDRASIKKWHFDKTGGLKGLQQRGYRPDSESLDTIELPIEKLVIWTWCKEAGDPEGIGMLRRAYKAYFMKSAMEEFAMIRIERQACGMPYAIGPEEGYTDDDSDKVLDLMTRIRTGEETGLVAPAGWVLGMLEMGAADVPFETHIERQHQYELQSGNAGFVGLGQGGDTGAWALSRDLSSIFLMNEAGIAKWVCQYFNRYCIPQIVRANATGVEKMPKLTPGTIAVRDPRVISEAIAAIFDPKLALGETYPEVEKYMRDVLKLPPKPEEATKKPPEEKAELERVNEE